MKHMKKVKNKMEEEEDMGMIETQKKILNNSYATMKVGS
jgi:hypothetical protein